MTNDTRSNHDQSLELDRVFLPRVAFSAKVQECNDHHQHEEIAPNIWRTKDKADASILRETNVAAGVCNADCHIGLVWLPEERLLTVSHFGLKNFYNPTADATTMDALLQHHNLSQKNSMLWLGGGIGSCCNGYNQVDQYIKDNHPAAQPGLVAKGARRGQEALDNMELLQQLHGHHFNVTIQSPTCTSCQGATSDDTIGDFFSNVRDVQKKLHRNCFLAWIG